MKSLTMGAVMLMFPCSSIALCSNLHAEDELTQDGHSRKSELLHGLKSVPDHELGGT